MDDLRGNKHELSFSKIAHDLRNEKQWMNPVHIHMKPNSSFTCCSPSFTRRSISPLGWSLFPYKETELGATRAKCLEQVTRYSIDFWKMMEKINTELTLMHKHKSCQCPQHREEGGRGTNCKEDAHCCLTEQQKANSERRHHFYSLPPKGRKKIDVMIHKEVV